MNFIVPLVIYPFDIMFSIGESDKELKSEMKSRLSKAAYKLATEDDFLFGSIKGQNAHTLFIRGHCQTIVRLGLEASSGTIAHEIFHVVDMIFRHINISLTKDSDEAYAYLIGYITDKYYEAIANTKPIPYI